MDCLTAALIVNQKRTALLQATAAAAGDKHTRTSLFWADYARHLLKPPAAEGGDSSFLSEHAHTAATSFTSAVFALALLTPTLTSVNADTARQHSHTARGCALDVRLAAPALIFVQETRAQEDTRALAPRPELSGKLLLIDATAGSTARPFQGPALIGHQYSWRVIVSNSSADEAAVTVVAPVPPTAVPLCDSLPLNVSTVTCAPYSCVKVEAHFYFPEPGTVMLPRVTLVVGNDIVAALETDIAALEVLICLAAALIFACFAKAGCWLAQEEPGAVTTLWSDIVGALCR